MVVEEGLVTYLLAQPTITGVIGQRLYPIHIPQNPTLPAIAYQRISTPRTYSHQGFSNRARPRIQLTLFALSYSACKDLAEKLRAVLAGYRGLWGTVNIFSTFVDNELDDYDTETQQYRRIIDLLVDHFET